MATYGLYMMAVPLEHPKTKILKFTPLSEMTSIPTPFKC